MASLGGVISAQVLIISLHVEVPVYMCEPITDLLKENDSQEPNSQEDNVGTRYQLPEL